MAKAAAPSLDKVRERIDAIDRDLLRLIDQRAVLTRDVAAAKQAAGEGGKFALRPAREAQILRRLIASEREAASRGLIVGVWRELMGDSLYQQSNFHIAVWGAKTPAKVAELARVRFGSAPPMFNVDQPEQAIASVRSNGGVAVLAITREHAWWARLLLEPSLSIFAILPCVSQWGSPAAMAVAQVTPEPSGEGDETLWVTDSPKYAYEIETAMGQDGMAARLVAEANGLKLFALAGFYQANDDRLARAPGKLTGVVGVVPVAFDLI